MIRLLLVDDQDIVRAGLRAVLKSDPTIQVVAEASNGEEALNRCKTNEIDVILMDLRMPIMNGVEATKQIKNAYPNIKIIVFTTFQEDQDIFDSIKYGASGYLLKDSEPEKIIEAIATVYEGGALIQPSVAHKVISVYSQMANQQTQAIKDPRIQNLTEKEMEVFIQLANGLSNKEIAALLFISEGTVKNHITSILNKMELRDRTQLAIFAVKNGY